MRAALRINGKEMNINKEILQRVNKLWPKIFNGMAANAEARIELVMLFNEIYDGNYKVNTTCTSCLNACYTGIRRVWEENNYTAINTPDGTKVISYAEKRKRNN